MKRDIALGHTNESWAARRQQAIQKRKGVNAEGEASQRDGERIMGERKHKNQHLWQYPEGRRGTRCK